MRDKVKTIAREMVMDAKFIAMETTMSDTGKMTRKMVKAKKSTSKQEKSRKVSGKMVNSKGEYRFTITTKNKLIDHKNLELVT